MKPVLLDPDTNLRAKFQVPRDGKIEYHVESDGGVVDVFVVAEEGLRNFDQAKPFKASVVSVRRYDHHERVKLGFAGSWYLLIVNRSKKQPVAVTYEVY